MPQTLEAPVQALNAVDYFKAKLQFENSPRGVHEIMKLPSVVVLDVRDRGSYAREHVPGAWNIPLAELPRKAADLPKDKIIVCYCWTIACALAPKAALELAHRGYKVQEMVGGIAAWKADGYPVQGPAQGAEDDDTGEMAPRLDD